MSGIRYCIAVVGAVAAIGLAMLLPSIADAKQGMPQSTPAAQVATANPFAAYFSPMLARAHAAKSVRVKPYMVAGNPHLPSWVCTGWGAVVAAGLSDFGPVGILVGGYADVQCQMWTQGHYYAAGMPKPPKDCYFTFYYWRGKSGHVWRQSVEHCVV